MDIGKSAYYFCYSRFCISLCLKAGGSGVFYFSGRGTISLDIFSRFINENILFYESSREFLLSFPISPLKYLASKLTVAIINFILPLSLMIGLLEIYNDFTIAQYLLLPISLLPLIISTFFIGNIFLLHRFFFVMCSSF